MGLQKQAKVNYQWVLFMAQITLYTQPLKGDFSNSNCETLPIFNNSNTRLSSLIQITNPVFIYTLSHGIWFDCKL